MKKEQILFVTIMAIALSFMIVESEAGCWNFITGSRCDNEDFWSKLGYKRCNDNCHSKGYKSGRCEKNAEHCLGLSRNSNVCHCYN